MSFTLSKDQGQGQVMQGHQIKMLHECRATDVLWFIWEVELVGGSHFLI